MFKEFITLQAATRRLGLTKTAIRRLIEQGEIQAFSTPTKRTLVNIEPYVKKLESMGFKEKEAEVSD